jgi:tetratricopeptide (TPR) repeat protein
MKLKKSLHPGISASVLAGSLAILLATASECLSTESSTTYDTRMERGKVALSRADYTQAEILFRGAIAAVERTSPSDGRYLDAVVAMCEVFNQTGRSEACDSLRETALAFVISSLGPQDSVVTKFVIEEVSRLLVKHRYEDSERLLNYAVKSCEKLLGDNHPALATYLNNLGTLYYYQGWFKRSEECLKRALEIDLTYYGVWHPVVGEDLHNLAELYLQIGRPDKAQPLFERAEAIADSTRSLVGTAGDESSDDRPLTLDRYQVSGADTYERALEAIRDRDYQSAIELNRQAINEADSAGESGVWIEEALEQLAALLHQRQAYAEAEPIHKRLLAIRENSRGPHDLLVATTLNNLGLVYAVQGRHSDAVLCYERALAIRQSGPATDWRQLAMLESNLAGSLRATKDYANSIAHYNNALQLRLDSLGSSSTEVAVTFRALAGAYQDNDDRKGAVIALERASEILRENPGSSASELVATLWPLGQLYEYEREFGRAESCYVELIAVLESSSQSRPILERASHRLGAVYASQGNYADAERTYARLIAMMESSYGVESLELVSVLNSQAMLFAEQGKLVDAEPVQRRALDLLDQQAAKDDPRLITVLSNLGVILRGLEKPWEADVVEARALQLKLEH